jgi:type IV pilus assembly protein PilM
MFRLKLTTIFPIGVDVGHDDVKMIQLHRVGERLSVLASARIGLPPECCALPQSRGKVVADLVRRNLRRGGFRGRRVVAAVPGDLLHVRSVRIGDVPASELAAAVRGEARSLLPFDLEAASLQFIQAGEIRQGGQTLQEIIVLAARHSDINQYISPFSARGIQLESLDVEPCALYRTVGRFVRRRDDERDIHALVDIGTQRTQVVIGRGRELAFTKPIEIGSRHLQEAMSRKLGVTADEVHALRQRLAEHAVDDSRDPVRQAVNDATRGLVEELGREIALCLRYHAITFRGQRPTTIRLSGAEIGDPQLVVMLNRVLPIPVQIARVLANIDSKQMGMGTEWAIALGLALKGVQGSYGPRDGKPREASATQVVELKPAGVSPGVTGVTPVSIL